MSFLAPLFFAALAGAAIPVVLHLIRPRPKGSQVFSSLMFLQPSPPRMVQRRRIQNWWLLALRLLALALLTLAFVRPLLRSSSPLAMEAAPGRRIALLIDVSASMRREDVWRAAIEQAGKRLDQAEPGDQFCLIAFDEFPRVLVDWPESPASHGASVAAIKAALNELRPQWSATDLGAAVTFAADALIESNDQRQSDAALQIVVVTDLQRGADLNALQASQWPEQVRVAFDIAAGRPGNATVRLMRTENDAGSDQDGESRPSGFRVRLSNSVDNAEQTFQATWADAGGPKSPAVTITTPPGETRVASMPAPAPGVDRVVLSGDHATFDDVFYFAPFVKRRLNVAIWMSEASQDAEQLRFYLEAALRNRTDRELHLLGPDAALDDSVQIVFVRDAMTPEKALALRSWLSAGGCAWWVLADPAEDSTRESVRAVVANESLELEESESDESLLSEIDFSHPVFVGLASPKYSDFSDVRFWGHRRLRLPDGMDARTLARFDAEDAALVEVPVGSGRLVVMTAGWRPDESQLARVASKFVPMIEGAVNSADTGWRPPAGLVVGDAISDPNGDTEEILAEQPGVFTATTASAAPVRFAVNLAASESDTTPRDPNELTQWGVALGMHSSRDAEAQRRRNLMDVDLEQRQKLWRWALTAVMMVLIVETLVAAHTARQAHEAST